MTSVLLIEDNAEIRESTAELLSLANYRVYEASNGKEGVELAKKKLPDIIVSDIMMPEMDGYAVLNVLSRIPETAQIPFLFLSAKSERSDIRKGMTLGADDYITKPFEDTELFEAIETRLKKKKHIKNELESKRTANENFVEYGFKFADIPNKVSNTKSKTLKAKDVLFYQGDTAHYLYWVKRGKIKCTTVDNYGKELVNGIFCDNDFLGYLNLIEASEFHESAIAIEESEVVLIPKTDFLQLVFNHRDLATTMIKLLSKDVIEHEKRMLQLAYASVRERLAIELVNLIDKAKKLESFNGTLQLSREDLANLVGTAKESLIRTLSEFKKDGLLQTSGKEISILNEEKLRNLAGM